MQLVVKGMVRREVAWEGRSVGLRRDFAEADWKWWCWARRAEGDRARKRPWPAHLRPWPDLECASRGLQRERGGARSEDEDTRRPKRNDEEEDDEEGEKRASWVQGNRERVGPGGGRGARTRLHTEGRAAQAIIQWHGTDAEKRRQAATQTRLQKHRRTAQPRIPGTSPLPPAFGKGGVGLRLQGPRGLAELQRHIPRQRHLRPGDQREGPRCVGGQGAPTTSSRVQVVCVWEQTCVSINVAWQCRQDRRQISYQRQIEKASQ